MQEAEGDSGRCGVAAPEFIVIEADLCTDAVVLAIAGLLIHLRPGMTEHEAVRFLHEAAEQGYRALLCRTCGCSAPAAMAGFRILATSRGRILMLEDLVVDNGWRRHGLGAALLRHLHAVAAATGCVRIELDTGRSNHPAQRFYATEGFQAIAVHLATDVRPGSGRA